MSLIIAMSLFALSMSVSPGPVNLVTFGRCQPHMDSHFKDKLFFT